MAILARASVKIPSIAVGEVWEAPNGTRYEITGIRSVEFKDAVCLCMVSCTDDSTTGMALLPADWKRIP